jgi:hypothetical protein
MEAMDHSGLRFSGGGKTLDPSSGQYLQDITQRQSFRSMYDLNMPRTIESIQNSYPTEIMDFPDVFDLPDIAEVWISRLGPFRVMPMSLTDRLDYSFTELVWTLSACSRPVLQRLEWAANWCL